MSPPATAPRNPHENKLRGACAALGLPVDDSQADKLLLYLAQLQRWNRTYNLTAIRDPEQMLIQHIFDSLAVVGPLDTAMPPDGRLYDIGSGAGLPGVVLAIMRPAWQVTCIDAVEKKIAFVRQMCGVLQLPNLAANHSRVETMASGLCHVVTSRAFAALQDFASLAGHHVRSDGTLVALKGKIPDEEIERLQAATDWQVEKIESLSVPELDAQRCLIWMRRSAGSSQGTP
jgi:16S rRNA (guanine527-N7)-methyltransferase